MSRPSSRSWLPFDAVREWRDKNAMHWSGKVGREPFSNDATY